MASPLTSTGLGSGLDVNGMVTKLVAAERAAADQRLTTTDKNLTIEFSAISQLKGAMSGLQTSAAALGVAVSRVLMVGDSPPDVLAAQAAGCPAVLVDWGYGAQAVSAELPAWRTSRNSVMPTTNTSMDSM
jgi:phosphoglycolate phosphatase-like HAD superfamily hydrolase